ncbi:MAG: hypothetical protein ABIK85_08535 [Candidatus Eisenbacteria bacterium]
MKNSSVVVASVVIAVLLLTCSPCAAQIPTQMNYQVMLTNDDDEPLADQSVSITFRIYTQEVGGGPVWNETHLVTTNSIGVATVVLGSLTPLDVDFDVPLWLQVDVGGETLTPRHPLLSAPYARRSAASDHADEADHAADADHAAEADHATTADSATSADSALDSAELDGVPAAAYALDDDLSQAGSLNDPLNPLEWTQLKNVPAGFADGIDDAGAGVADGHSLDAEDGFPVDVVRVDTTGRTYVGTVAPVSSWGAALSATSGSALMGMKLETDSYYANVPGMHALCDESTAIIANAKLPLGWMNFPMYAAGVYGSGEGNANGGQFVSLGSGKGLVCGSSEDGHSLHSRAYGTGYSGFFEDGAGVYIETAESTPVVEITSTRTSGVGDALHLFSQPNVSSSTWTLKSECGNGVAGAFVKSNDDDEYAVYVAGDSPTSEGLYVSGTIVSTAPLARVVETSRGREAVFGVASPSVEIIVSGLGRLSAGAARVEFDRLFTESIAGPEDLRVTATPIGGWSALYVENADASGFDLKSDAGDKEIAFYWMAMGRAAGHERNPELTLPDGGSIRELAGQKDEETVLTRPERREQPGVVTARGSQEPVEVLP